MAEKVHYITREEDKISLKQKAAYSVGMLVNNLQAAALPAMVVILNIGLGMDVMLVGLTASIPRIWWATFPIILAPDGDAAAHSYLPVLYWRA
jgi:hypothetical protein